MADKEETAPENVEAEPAADVPAEDLAPDVPAEDLAPDIPAEDLAPDVPAEDLAPDVPAEDLEAEPPAPEPPEPEPPTPAQSSPKKSRVQVDPNASTQDTATGVNCLTSLPVVPDEPCAYTPILYTFRVKPRGKSTNFKHMTTKPPPFYLVFDHAIAVIWTIFSKTADKDKLGIVQLQWALHLLKCIYNREGVHPKDVQLCIDVVENYLINEYAELSEESVVYGSYKFGDFVEEKKTAPFSFNYSQMITKCPVCAVETEDSTTFLDRQMLEDLQNVKNVVGIDSLDLTKVVSKDQMLNVLHDWKKEQIDKIEEELRMLYVVEDMLKNSDSQNFEGYTNEKQFEMIFRKN